MSQGTLSSAKNLLPPPATKPGGSWANRVAMLALVFIVLGPVAYGFIPREIARWYAAAAQEADWSGDYPRAVALLDKAIAWDGHNAQWWMRRAQLHEAREKYDLSLADCDMALKVDPDDLLALIAHCQAALHLKKYDDAYRDLELIQERAEDNNYLLVNTVAYLQAVAQRDLDRSLELANSALNYHRNHADHSLRMSMFMPEMERELREVMLLDTRGYVYLQQGKAEEARADFDNAVQRGKVCLARQEEALQRNSVDPRELEQAVQQAKKMQAVMTYHRSLAFEKLDLPIEAALDREEVRRLGFKPSENLF